MPDKSDMITHADMSRLGHVLPQKILNTTLKGKDVRRLVLFTFLAILRESICSCNESSACRSKNNIIQDAMMQIKKLKHIRDTRLYEVFSTREVSAAWDKAAALLLDSYVRHHTRVADDSRPTCRICMENIPDFLFVHGSSAHGGVCGGCALRVAMKVRPKCPMCNQRVNMVCVRSSARASQLRVFDP